MRLKNQGKQYGKKNKKSIVESGFLLSFLLFSIMFCPVCSAVITEELSPVNTPNGAVIFIIDGLSSCYVYPEYTPHAINGDTLEKAKPENMLTIFDQSCRVTDVEAPQTFTEGGHSVLVTGYTGADSEIAGAYGTSIYDIAHDNDYLTFAIMEKGDSSGISSKQDVIIHDVDNSITEPGMITSINGLSGPDKEILLEVADLLQDHSSELQAILDNYPEGSQEKYNAYNVWAIETGVSLIEYMNNEHPDKRYILTINVGAVDSAGHYRKNDGYVATIEGIDNASMDLYKTCNENNIAFILTADHGMSFSTADSRGGHQAEKYSVMDESQKIPLIISAADVNPGIVEGTYGQEDIAPTILEVLNMPGKLRIADGKAIPVKEYTNIKVEIPEKGTLEIRRNDELIFKDLITDTTNFMGLDINTEYVLNYKPFDSEKEIETSVITLSESSINLDMASNQPKSDKSYQNPRYIVGGSLIGIINLAGFMLIRKILRE